MKKGIGLGLNTLQSKAGVWTINEAADLGLQGSWPRTPLPDKDILSFAKNNAVNGIQGEIHQGLMFDHLVGPADGLGTFVFDTVSNTFTSTNHGLSVDDKIYFEGPDLPSPIESKRAYKVLTIVDEDNFRISELNTDLVFNAVTTGVDGLSRVCVKTYDGVDTSEYIFNEVGVFVTQHIVDGLSIVDHGLSVDDYVKISEDAVGLPVEFTAGEEYQVATIVDPDTFTLKTLAGVSVSFTSDPTPSSTWVLFLRSPTDFLGKSHEVEIFHFSTAEHPTGLHVTQDTYLGVNEFRPNMITVIYADQGVTVDEGITLGSNGTRFFVALLTPQTVTLNGTIDFLNSASGETFKNNLRRVKLSSVENESQSRFFYTELDLYNGLGGPKHPDASFSGSGGDSGGTIYTTTLLTPTDFVGVNGGDASHSYGGSGGGGGGVPPGLGGSVSYEPSYDGNVPSTATVLMVDALSVALSGVISVHGGHGGKGADGRQDIAPNNACTGGGGGGGTGGSTLQLLYETSVTNFGTIESIGGVGGAPGLGNEDTLSKPADPGEYGAAGTLIQKQVTGVI